MQKLFLSLLCCCLSVPLVAQLFPVESQIVVRPPSSVYLSDFTEPGSERLGFMLSFNDNNEPDYDVRLHLRLEGNGVVLETSPNFMPSPLTLTPDGMRRLELIEWSEYLDPNNLVIVGLDQSEFSSSGGKLPEGMYQLCLTVRDFRRPDVDLSRQNCTVLSLRKNNPPQAFVPTCGGVVQPTPTNQVQLNWQANHDALVNAQYTIEMVKVEPGQDPNQAILAGSQRLLPDVEIRNRTSYTIDPSDPISTELIYGETYAYRINVTDLDGLTTFENDGIGEVCWFTYGFLAGGQLGINFPLQDNRVNPSQPLTFRWNGPTNATAGTRIYYKLRVADVTDGSDPVTALEQANLLIDEQTTVTGNLSSWNFTFPDELETERQLAWVVEAYVDGAETEAPLAESEVVTFRTTPLLDKFRAGQYTVLVNTAGNSTIDDFSGTGTVQINDELNAEVQFEHLVIEQLSTANVLMEGIVISDLEENIELIHPEGGSYFETNRLELDKNFLTVRGRVIHQFGLLADNAGGPFAKIQSPELTMSFEGGELVGIGNFEATNISPTDLPGLTIQYDATSTYAIDQSILEYSFNGKYKLADPVSYMDGQTVEYAFSDQTSIYQQSLILPSAGQVLQLTENDEMNLIVKGVEVDFLLEESPEGSGLEDSWTGLYVKTGRVMIPTDFDADEAIIPLEELSFTLADMDEPVTFSGKLNFKLEKSWEADQRPRAGFYSFLDDWTSLNVEITEGVLVNGELLGEVYIPFLHETEMYPYSVSVTDQGFETASFDAILEESILFDGGNIFPGDDLTFTVKEGHFLENDKLVLTVDIYVAAFDLVLENVPNLTLWGDGAIGFGNQQHALAPLADNPLVNIIGFPGNLVAFGVSYQVATESLANDVNAPDGSNVWDRRVRYLFAYEANANLGTFFSSLVPGDGPTLAFSLDQYREMSVLLPENHTSDLDEAVTSMPDKWTDYWEALQAQDEEEESPDFFDEAALPLLLAQAATTAIPGVANVSVGRLQILTNDEDWGNLFALQTEIEMLRPFAFRIQINVFAGHVPWSSTPDGYAYTSVKLGLKDGTEGNYQGLDNHLQNAKSNSLFQTGNLSEGQNATSNGRLQPFGLPFEIRYLALGVHLNMDYNANGKLMPTEGRYGGLLGFNIRLNWPIGKKTPGSSGLGGDDVGKTRVEVKTYCEILMNASRVVTYVHIKLGAEYTETVSGTDHTAGGNYIKVNAEGSFDWDTQTISVNVGLDLWFPPVCAVVNAGFVMQMHPETKELRKLDIDIGSYENRNTIEYCQAIEGGDGASVGYSYGLVFWLQLAMDYGLPMSLLPSGQTNYADINEDLAFLDDRMAAFSNLSQTEQGIIAAAMNDPSELPEDIRNDPDFQTNLMEFQDTYGTQVWAGEIGLGATVSAEARMDEWIDIGIVRFLGFITAEVSVVAWGNMQISPVVILNEIGGEINGNISVGAYYEELDGLSYSGNVKSFVAASITIMAQVVWKVPEELVTGHLEAQLQFIELPTGGFLVDVPLELDFEASVATE